MSGRNIWSIAQALNFIPGGSNRSVADLAEEVAGALLARMVEEGIRIRDLDDLALDP
jgi:hypothetical protein